MNRKCITFAVLAWSAAARATDLSVPVQIHTVACPATAACPIRKPPGVGGWELLSKDVILEEKGEGMWLADFSKAKDAAGGKATLRVLAADGQIVQVEASFPKRPPEPRPAKRTAPASATH